MTETMFGSNSWRAALRYSYVLAVMVSVLCVQGCSKSVEPSAAEQVCEHYAELSLAEFPGLEELSEAKRDERHSELVEYCMTKFDEGKDLTPKQVSCMEESASLDDIAVCRRGG